MDNFESIDITPQTQEPAGIDLPKDNVPRLPQPVVDTRSDKATLGLSSLMGKTKDDISAALGMNEPAFRRQAAATVDLDKYKRKQDAVGQILKQGRQVDPKALADFMVPEPSTDPRSVIEEKYSQEFMAPIMDMANEYMRTSSMGKAIQEVPKQARDLFNAGSDLIARGEYARKRYQDMAELYRSQGWLMWGVQRAAEQIPGFKELALEDTLLPGRLGTSMEEKRQSLWNLPFDQYKDELDKKFESFKDNPGLGTEYFKDIVGQSTEDIVWDNFGSYLSAAVVAGLGKGRAPKVPWGAFSKAEILGDILEPMKDVGKATADVREAPIIDLSPEEYAWENEGGALGKRDLTVVHPDARGDIQEAAVKQAAQNTLKDINQTVDPTSRTVMSLPTIYKKDQRGVRTNPGNYGQEIVNRLDEETTAHIDRISEAVQTTARVNRIPEAMASEDVMRKVREETRDKFPELSGSLINVDGPHWNKGTNSWEVHFILGRHTGEYHPKFIEAQNWARVHGIPIQTTEKVFTEKTVRRIGDKTVPGPTRILKDPNEVLQAGATIERKGFGFYVQLPVPIDLRSSIIRAAYGTTEFSKLPQGIADNWVDAMIGWLRNPDEISSVDDRIGRKIANGAPENYFEVAREAVKDIARIAPASQRTMTRAAANRRWDEWGRMINATKDIRDPATGEKGYDFRGPGEIENWYLSNLDPPRMPDEDELAAYFAFKRIHADDYMYRSMSMARDKLNVGAMEHRFQVTGSDGKQMWSPWVEGVRLTELPGGADTIAVFKRHIDHTHLMPSNMMGKARDEVSEEVKTGRAIAFEVYNPDHTPLAGFGPLTDENQVRYVVGRDHQTRPINVLNQLPRRGGPHIEYDYPAYLKEPDVVIDPTTKKARLRGDKTVYALVNQAQGEQLAKGLNEVKKLIKAADITGAQAKYESMFETGNLIVPWKEFYEQHIPTKNKKGEITKRARLNPDEPFVVVPRDKTIADMPHLMQSLHDRYENLEDGTRTGSLAKQFQIQFTGQRDAYEMYEVQDVGKRHNPIFKYNPAKTVDAIPMQTRALNRIMNDYGGMADQRMSAAEHWLFGDADHKGNGAAMYIDTGTKNNIAAVQHSPFYYFNNYKLLPGTDDITKRLIDTQNYKAKSFAGVKNSVDVLAETTAQKLADSVYGRFGPVLTKDRELPFTKRKYTLDPIWMIPKITDGPRLLRAMSFYTTMPFHVAMFPVHLSTYVNVFGIAGARPAAGGAFGALVHAVTAFNRNPEILNYLDGLASKANFLGYNFKPGQWKEAFEGMMSHGANVIEPAKLTDIDNPVSQRILQTKTGAFFDLGLIPFKAGLKPMKLASWYTAYLERRNGGGGKFNWETKSTGRLTDKDWGEINERADILSHNMTRASTSAPQKGLASIPMQYQGYHLRVLELAMGKRLNWKEKARFAGTLLTLYGVTGAAGVVGLSSIATNIAKDEGYVPGNDFLSTMVWEGILSAGVGKMTGGGDIQKGNIYNFGQRYGVGDFEMLNNFLDGDPTMWSIWGAAPNKIDNTIAATGPFRKWGLSFLKGNEQFQLTPEHWTGLLKEIFTSANDVDKLYWGTVANRWMSKNGRTIASDVSASNALFMVLSGLQELRLSRTHNVSQEIRNLKDMEQKAFNLSVKEAVAAFQDRHNGDYDNAAIHEKNARAYLEGYPEHKWTEVVAAVRRSAGDLVDTLDRERYLGKHVPQNARQQAQDTYEKIRQIQKKREEP